MTTRQLNQSQSVAQAVRRELMACMETGNVDRARTVFTEYKAAVQGSPTLQDHSEDLRTDVLQAYAVGL